MVCALTADCNITLFRGVFFILSAFSLERSEKVSHLYRNSQYERSWLTQSCTGWPPFSSDQEPFSSDQEPFSSDQEPFSSDQEPFSSFHPLFWVLKLGWDTSSYVVRCDHHLELQKK